MISGIGVDVEEVRRFRENFRDRAFTRLLFTGREIAYCMKKKEPYIHFAGKFCAKEAVIKASSKSLGARDIEVVNSVSGRVSIYVKGKKQAGIHCSIAHTEGQAVAFVVWEKYGNLSR